MVTGYAGNIPLHLIGFFHYTTYRIVLLQIFFETLWIRNWKKLFMFFLISAGVITLVLCSDSRLSEIYLRGTGNFLMYKLNYIKNFIFSLLLPFFPVFQSYAKTSVHFSADYVHWGLVALGRMPPLSLGIAVLVIIGVFHELRTELLLKNKSQSRRLLCFYGLCLLLIGFMGPSLSRFLILVPFFCIFAFIGYSTFKKSMSLLVLVLVLSLGLYESWNVFAKFGDKRHMEPIFHGRIPEIVNYIEQKFSGFKKEQIFWVTEHNYSLIKYAEKRSDKFSAYPPISPDDFERILRYASNGSGQIVIFDEVPQHLLGFSRAIGFHDRRLAIETYLKTHAKTHVVILEEKEIMSEGRKLGHFISLMWR